MGKNVDWSFVKPLFEAGGLSNVEIAQQYNDIHKDQDEFKPTITEGAIRKRAKEKKWKKTLADRIKRAAKEKLVRGEYELANRSNFRTQDEADDATVEAAAESIAAVLKLHRKDIDRLKLIENDLIQRIESDEDQIVIGWYQGEATEHIVKLGLDARSKVMARLVAIVGRRISLERIAWGIDDRDGEKDKPDSVEVIQEF